MPKIRVIKAKLKLCPFCGGRPLMEKDPLAYWITCWDCGMGSFGSTSKAHVVEAWNKRKKSCP